MTRTMMFAAILISLPQVGTAQSSESERASENGFMFGFDGMGGVDRSRGAYRNGGLRLGARLRPVPALGFDIGIGVAFLGYRTQDTMLNGLEGTLHLDVRTYFNGGGTSQPFVVGGLRYGRFFATNASSECPSVHSPSPSEPTISTNMSFYDLSGGAGLEIRLNAQSAVVWDVRALRRTSVRGAEFERDARNDDPTSRHMLGWSTQIALVVTASAAEPPADPKPSGWW